MEQREFGKSGLRVSVIGAGTWAIGGPWEFGWGPVNDEASIEAIRKALDLGVNLVDTADAYGLGHSEEVVGKAIAGRRSAVILATKFGLLWDERTGATTGRSGERAHVMAACEASLRRLNTDYIDLYQIHWPDLATPLEETLQAMQDLVTQGKVRYLGVSNCSVDQLQVCKQFPAFCADQPPYNLFSRRIEDDVLPFCQQAGIGLLTYAALAYGFLAGAFQADHQFAEGDWRPGHAAFQGEAWQKNLAIVDQLKTWCADRGHTIGELAIAWVLANPAVTAALVGSTSAQHVRQNVRAAEWRLTPAERAEVTAIAQDATGIYFD